MIPMAAKLHMMLLLICVAVAVYMYFIYKDVREMQTEMHVLKKQMNELLSQQGGESLPQSKENVEKATIKINKGVESQPPKSVNVVFENIDDDDASVTSNEIKDILTNIQDVDEVHNITVDPDPDEFVINEKKPVPDLSLLSEIELMAMKYDDLRNYLRRQGSNPKGTKQELVKKIKGIIDGSVSEDIEADQ